MLLLVSCSNPQENITEVANKALRTLPTECTPFLRIFSTPSRICVTDNAYAPFGENYNSTGTHTTLEFTGVNADTTNGSLYDFMFRSYSANQGRWISPDPAGLGALDPTNPQSWNRYAYVESIVYANNVSALGVQAAEKLAGPPKDFSF
jgi:RHS repeat-associated protein